MPPAVKDDEETTEETETDLTENPDAAFEGDFEAAAGAVVADDDEGVEEEPTLAVEDGESLDDDEEEGESEGVRDLTIGEDEPAPAKDTKAAKPGVDRGDGRDVEGKFVPKPGDASAAAASSAAAPAAAEQPKWDTYTVRAERETVPLDGVQVSRKDGYAIIAMPEKALGRFNERIARGHLAEKFWRELKAERDTFEFERAAPPKKSDAEIEGQLIAEAMKPHVADFLSLEQIENLELRIAIAKREASDEYTKNEATRRTTADTERSTREEQANEPAVALDWMRQEFLHVLGNPQFNMGPLNLTPEEVTQVFNDLVPLRKAVVYREGNDWYSERDVIVQRLRAKAAARSSAAAPAGVTAAPAASRAVATAERFNKGQATAATPGKAPASTSVKANRATNGQRPRSGSPARSTREPPRVSPQQQAEDNWVNTRKRLMRSDSLDFDEDGDS
jgi:hypothetical protein